MPCLVDRKQDPRKRWNGKNNNFRFGIGIGLGSGSGSTPPVADGGCVVVASSVLGRKDAKQSFTTLMLFLLLMMMMMVVVISSNNPSRLKVCVVCYAEWHNGAVVGLMVYPPRIQQQDDITN